MTDAAPSPSATPLPSPPAHPRRIAYFGTPEVAVPPLRALVAAGFDVVVVVTRADKRRGRRGEPAPSPVKAAAAELGIPVVHDPDAAAEHGADLGVVVAFGRILRRPLLERLPMVNLHFSLLPRWRGAAPVERAILAGDDRTGVCVMAVEEGLDTGGVYAVEEVEVGDRSAADLAAELTEVGSRLLVSALQEGLGEPEAQVGETTYAEKLTTEDRRIDWSSPAAQVLRQVRVGGAWTTVDGKRFKVHEAGPSSTTAPGGAAPGALVDIGVVAGDGGLVDLYAVQPEGKAAMKMGDWLRGAGAGVADGFVFGADVHDGSTGR